MLDHSSRYAGIETAVHVGSDGVEHPYVRRRFLPSAVGVPLLAEVTVAQGDRLDLIAARTLGVPEVFWRIADANAAMDPVELTDVPGRTLRVPLPQAIG